MAEPTFPPPDVLAGYLEFMHRVILIARVMGWRNAPHDQIADLMDAVHNLPVFLSHWDGFDQGWFRRDLEVYDKRWAEGGSLLTCLDDCLKQPRDAP